MNFQNDAFFVLILDNTIGRRDRDGNRVMKKLPPLTKKEKKKKEKEKASFSGSFRNLPNTHSVSPSRRRGENAASNATLLVHWAPAPLALPSPLPK